MTATGTITAAEALDKLAQLRTNGRLSMLQISSRAEHGTARGQAADASADANAARASDASSSSSYVQDNDTPTPASLSADLIHYKELFSKLRFSYLEQVTKEKFLRAITAETPLFIEPSDNLALEAQLVAEKIGLKEQKLQVSRLTGELEHKGRELANRYEALQKQGERLKELPEKLERMQARLDELRESYPSPIKSENPDLNLPLAETLSLLSRRQEELANVDQEIADLQARLPCKNKELERLEGELALLSQQKKMAVAGAKEAKDRKARGGMDEVERRGRWLRSGEALLTSLLA